MARRGDNIHKRIDGRWEGRYKVGKKDTGQIIYKSVYAHSYSECKAKLEYYQTEKENILDECFISYKFKDVIVLWLKNIEIRVKGSTEAKYEQLLESHILPEFGESKISNISATMINTFLSKKLKGTGKNSKGLSASYVRTMAIIFESVFNFAVSEKMCNPLKTAIHKPSIQNKHPQILSENEQYILERYILNDKSSVALGTTIAFYTGLRIGEICALQWSDIDLTNDLLYVNHTVSRVKASNNTVKTEQIISTPKTKASKRIVPITSALKPILQNVYSNNNNLFVVSNSEAFMNTRTFDYQFRKLFKHYHLNAIGFHTIRHTFATRCIQGGMDVKTLSEILGHSSAAITLNTYVHSSIEVKRKQLEKTYLSV